MNGNAKIGDRKIKLLRRFDEFLGKRYYAPVFLLAVLMISIFMAEVFVMFILAKLPQMTSRDEALFDGLMLTAIVAPLLYLLAFRPLVLHIIARWKIERFKDDIVKILCHDIKNPLWTAKENMDLMLSRACGVLTKDQEDILGDVKKAVDYLIRLTQNMLDAGQLEEGKVRLRKESFDVALLIKYAAGYFTKKAAAKGIGIIIDVPEGEMPLFADKDRIQEVVFNLIGNAVKFTDRGTVSVSVRSADGVIECVIKDTGRGIAQKDMSRLYGKFQKFGPNPDGEIVGTGLGLAICKEIVDLHSGGISVKSEPGKGTTVIFTLPVEQRSSDRRRDYEI